MALCAAGTLFQPEKLGQQRSLTLSCSPYTNFSMQLGAAERKFSQQGPLQVQSTGVSSDTVLTSAEHPVTLRQGSGPTACTPGHC